MSEENILLPKSRYDKLVANSTKGSEKDISIERANEEGVENDQNFNRDVSPQKDSISQRQNLASAEGDFSEKNARSEESEQEDDISLEKSPGRTVEDISLSSVPHNAIRPPGSKTLAESKTKLGNRANKKNSKKGGKKSVAEQSWIKW